MSEWIQLDQDLDSIHDKNFFTVEELENCKDCMQIAQSCITFKYGYAMFKIYCDCISIEKRTNQIELQETINKQASLWNKIQKE